jgi:hypothetical protein
MTTDDKWLSIIRDVARENKISLSSFSETRLKHAVGDIDAVINEFNSRSGYKLKSEEQRAIRKEIERRTR